MHKYCRAGRGGGVFLTFDEKGFTIEPTSLDSRCTAYSVSAHMLYENADPYCLREPSGILNTKTAVYEELDERRVRVWGSTFTHMPYTIKLEGAAHTGYQTVTIVGIRDRRILKNPQAGLSRLETYVERKLDHFHIERSSYDIDFKMYGWNGVSGACPKAGYVPNEIGVVMTVTAQSQEQATRIAQIYNPYLLHFPIEPEEQLPTFAFIFSPAEMERGPVYEFMLHHGVKVEDPMELFHIETEMIV